MSRPLTIWREKLITPINIKNVYLLLDTLYAKCIHKGKSWIKISIKFAKKFNKRYYNDSRYHEDETYKSFIDKINIHLQELTKMYYEYLLSSKQYF